MAGEVTNIKLYYGDTLEQVARRHFTTVDEILKMNPNIKNPELITVGDTLKVPSTIFDKQSSAEENVDSVIVKNTSASIAKIKNETKSEKEDNGEGSLKSVLTAGAGMIAGAALACVYFKRGNIASGIKRLVGQTGKVAKKTPAPMVPTAEAKEAIVKVETQLSRPTDYKAAADSLIPKVAPNHAAKQKELDEAFRALTPDTEKAVAQVKKNLSQHVDYKGIIDARIPKVPTAAEHAAKQKELNEAFQALTPEAEQALNRVKTQLNEATDYKAVIDSRISQAPTKAEHNKRLAELREYFDGTRIPKYRKGRKYTNLKEKMNADKRQARVKQNTPEQREEYLRSIGLGTAEPTQSSGLTWKKYLEERGRTYTPPVSGVVEADRRAAQNIAENLKKQQEQFPQFVSTSTIPELNFKYVIS